MLVFLDTEFTSFDEPYLISAGLIGVDGRELYFEMAGVSRTICSSFPSKAVWKHLGGPVVTPLEAAGQVANYLTPYGEAITFFTDAPRYDVELIRPFIPANIAISYAVPSFVDTDEEQIYRQAHKQAFASGLRRHHGLDDAKALRLAWGAVEAFRGRPGVV